MNWAGIQQLRRSDKNGHFTFQDKTNMSISVSQLHNIFILLIIGMP